MLHGLEFAAKVKKNNFQFFFVSLNYSHIIKNSSALKWQNDFFAIK